MEHSPQDLSTEVSNRYLSALIGRGHPLVATRQERRERARSAEAVVRDVIAELNGLPVPVPDPNDVRAALARFLSSRTGNSSELEANRLLFDCALPALVESLEFDAVSIASSLHRRLGRDLETAVDEAHLSGMLRPTTMPAMDSSRLPSGFTSRETQIVAELASGASRDEICSRLYISKKTLQNHISRISDKIDGRGERGILSRARSLGAIMAVPAMFVSAAISDSVTVLQDLI